MAGANKWGRATIGATQRLLPETVSQKRKKTIDWIERFKNIQLWINSNYEEFSCSVLLRKCQIFALLTWVSEAVFMPRFPILRPTLCPLQRFHFYFAAAICLFLPFPPFHQTSSSLKLGLFTPTKICIPTWPNLFILWATHNFFQRTDIPQSSKNSVSIRTFLHLGFQWLSSSSSKIE